MAETKYTYVVSTDFPNGKVDIGRLTQEIDNSGIVTKLANNGITVDGADCNIWFMAPLSGDDQTSLNSIVNSHSGEPLHPENVPVEVANAASTDSHNRTITVPEPETDRKMVNIATHNFCDKTTWWQQASPIVHEELIDSGDGLTFSSVNTHWIDLTHGKFYLEDRITNRDSYIPVVKVDGVTMTERAPFDTSGGDYVVDYAAGTVTFASSQSGKTVTASYYFAGSSLFTLAPDAGKVLWVRDSEVQFSVDVEMLSTLNFQAFAYDPNDIPNKIAVSQKTNYKTIRNFVEEAKGVYPKVPALSASGPRGLAQEHVVFPFRYTQVKALYSSQGVEIKLWLDEDVEFGGEFGTATFYCSSYDE